MALPQLFLTVLTVLYGISGTINILAYWPTIHDLLKGKPSANASSYLLWTGTGTIATLYVVIKIKDIPLMTIVGLNLVACLWIWILQANLDRKLGKKMNKGKIYPMRR